MRATLTKKDLQRALERCLAAIEAKGTVPIWSNVRIDIGTEFRVTAQSIERSVVGTVPARELASGSCLVDCKALLERVRSMQDGDLHLTKTRSGKEPTITLKSPSSSRKFQMRILDVDDYRIPEEPDSCLPTVVMQSSVLASVIASAKCAMSKDFSRIALYGMLFELESGFIRCVATDSHRVHVSQASIDCDETHSFLISSTCIESLRKLLDSSETKVTIRIGRANVFIDADGFRFGLRLTNAQFPPYEQVIPGPSETFAVVSRHGLIDAVKNVSVSKNENGGIGIEIDSDMLSITASNPDGGDGEDKVSAEHTGNLSSGCNVNYLLDALNSCVSDQVRIEYGGELDPIVIKPNPESDGFSVTAVVMPMRI